MENSALIKEKPIFIERLNLDMVTFVQGDLKIQASISVFFHNVYVKLTNLKKAAWFTHKLNLTANVIEQ